MNIIQIQDRLKGLPEDALVNYVKNPMGEVPIYLALGEMQRRKDMKARFDASQADKPSVAEQLVAETEPQQMGIAAMAPQGMMPQGQGVGAPQPQQAVDPRQLAASGIAANPQSAVGGTAMMAKGGIVGFAGGGRISKVKDFIFGKKNRTEGDFPPNTGTTLPAVRTPNALVTTTKLPDIPNVFKRAPIKTSAVVLGVPSAFYVLSPDGKTKLPISDNEANTIIDQEAAEKDSIGSREKYFAEFDKEMGSNENLIALNEKLAAMEERNSKSRGDAGNMSLIQAGLNIAAGQSPNALTNLATGATAGMQDYTQRLKDADASDMTSMQLSQALGLAERAEKMARLKYGTQSEQYLLALENKQNIATAKNDLYASEKMAAAIQSIRDGNEYMTKQSDLQIKLEDGDITQKSYNDQLQEIIDRGLATLYPSQVKTAGVGTAPVKVTSKEDFDKLLSGTLFEAPDGSSQIKN